MEDYVKHQVRNKTEKFVKKAFKILFFILAAIVFILLFAYVFMKLWNWLVPEIFGLGIITYWQALGLLVLAKIIFGGFEGKSKKGPKKRNGETFEGRLRRRCNDDYSKWKLYDQFWKEEGEEAFDAYVNRLQQENTSEDEQRTEN